MIVVINKNIGLIA